MNPAWTCHDQFSTCSNAERAELGVEPDALNAKLAQSSALHRLANWIILFSFCVLVAHAASAQTISKEYQIKAVCLWRLAQFVAWPTNAFPDTHSPIIISVLGENPFGDLLEAAVNGETAHGRRLLIQKHRTLEDVRTCHILFVGASEAGQLDKIFSRLADKSVLTVADFESFSSAKGGMVSLITRQNKVKLRINLNAVKAARLELDPRVLRSAEIANVE